MPSFLSRIKQHLHDPDSYHRRIAQGFLWVSAFVFIGKLAGAAKEMTIAWRYGVSEKVDAYVFLFNVLNWPIAVWFSVLAVVLVPLFASLTKETPLELPRFRSELLGFTILIGFLFGGIAYFLMPIALERGWLGLSGEALNEALKMSKGLSLLLPLGFCIHLFSVWLLTKNRHRNTLFEAIPALTIFIFLLLPESVVSQPLLWGTVLGFGLHLITLAIPLKRTKELIRPSFQKLSPAWQAFWHGMGIMIIIQAATSFTSLIDQLFAAQLSVGVLSVLSYSDRVLSLVLGLGATAVGRAVLPIFSELDLSHESALYELALRWCKYMLFLGAIIVLAMWLLAPWIIRLLFERGSFSHINTIEVSSILRMSIIQLPFAMSAIVLTYLVVSKKDYKMLLFFGMVLLIVKIAVTVPFTFLFQLEGLAFSTVLVAIIKNALFYVYLRRRVFEARRIM